MLKIKWFGHDMWKISSENVSVITDPFTDIGYQMPQNETADIVLSSHDHFDHNNFKLVKGTPKIVNTKGKYNIKGVDIENFETWHDENKGADRGKNLLMKFSVSEKTFLHCGDLGHMLSDELIKKIGNIDVIFIPVGGFYTIDAMTAKAIVEKISPRIVFPMHYKTPVLDFPIALKEAYLKLISSYRKVDSTELQLTNTDFKVKQTIIMNYE